MPAIPESAPATATRLAPPAPAGTRPSRSRWSIASIYFKLLFTKLVHYLEVCALPYLAGIACAVGFGWKFPPATWKLVSFLGVGGMVLVLYLPIVLLHAGYLFHLRRKQPGYTLIYFLEDKLSARGFTRLLAVLAMLVSFAFGALNYNFSVDTSSPAHLSRFVRKPWEANPATVRGEIIREPEFRDTSVWLFLHPREVVINGTATKITGGLVLVKLSKKVEGYENFEYGEMIEVKGDLLEAEPAMNPGAFDYKQHLNNRNIYGVMSISTRQGTGVTSKGMANVNPLFTVSLWVKEKFLALMKQTLPYPHSSFQGGIIYGLKTGLPEKELFQFKWAGMAWVLVVAGAHLLMVYLTLKMILESIRPNPKVGFVVLFAMLLMFLILTGINPPTVRAFIMLFLYEFTKVFLGQDIRAAVRSAIAIAAFLLLASHLYPYCSPLMIFDPTVTLSFGAVLSLSFLSRPIERLLMRYLYGLTSVVVLLGVLAALATMAILRPPTLSLLGLQLLPVAIVTLILALATIVFNNRHRRQHHFEHIYLGYNDYSMFTGWRKWLHPECFTYVKMPFWLRGFVGAQIAIQFGMVLPLSSWYFGRSPIGGVVANIIAFPALGAIIQVGLVAVLVGLIPVIGLPLALLLNAADYLGIQLLMSVAEWTEKIFPYPMAMRPDASQILFYYAILIGFIIFHHKFYSNDKRGYLTLGEFCAEKAVLTRRAFWSHLAALTDTAKKQAAVLSVCGLCVVSGGYFMVQGLQFDHLQLIVMELDSGSGTIVLAPDGKRFLVNTGTVPAKPAFDPGLRTIAPVLLDRQIEHLDGLILTSLLPDNIGGAAALLENFTVGKIYLPFAAPFLTRAGPVTDDDLAALGLNAARKSDEQVQQLLERMRRVIVDRGIPVIQVTDGDELSAGDGLTIHALNPPPDSVIESPDQFGNQGLVLLLTYGQSRLLIAGDLDAEGERALMARHGGDDLRAHFVLIPSHGRSSASSPGFVRAVQPDYAAVQYRASFLHRPGSPIESVLGRWGDETHVFRSDLQGAITVDAFRDGKVTVRPQLRTRIQVSTAADENGERSYTRAPAARDAQTAAEAEAAAHEERAVQSEGTGYGN